ncbi:MAG: hypothetical protein IKQ31_01700 [Clostridia bacterium]|nr:hypothetical protein [Clostridia bacterium]
MIAVVNIPIHITNIAIGLRVGETKFIIANIGISKVEECGRKRMEKFMPSRLIIKRIQLIKLASLKVWRG